MSQTHKQRQEEIQQLIGNYENMTFREDISNYFQKEILSNINQMTFFEDLLEEQKEEEEEQAQKIEGVSQILSKTATLFQSNEPLDQWFVQDLIEENQDQDAYELPKGLLLQTQMKLLTSQNSNKSVKEILQILKPLTISQRLYALSIIVQNLPVADILGKMTFKAQVVKCQFMNSQYPESKPIYSQLPFSNDINAPLLKILNQGFSSLYSDGILDPNLIYQLDVVFNESQGTNKLCYIGLLPDSQKDQKLVSELKLAFSIKTNQQQQQAQGGLFGQSSQQPKQQISFRLTIFICISEQTFIVCDQKGDIIYNIPETSIQKTTQYRIGILFETNNNQLQNQFGQAQIYQGQTYYQNLTVQSFKVLTGFPSLCI